MRELGVGVIGTGFMGKTHTYALKTIPLYYPGFSITPRLAAICSGSLVNAANAAQSLGFAYHTDDYKALLARPDVDAVSVCTPNDLHERMVLDALAAGKHVYVDKPLSVNAPSARRMADAARASGLVCQMAMHNRFLPSTMRAKQIVDAGMLGRITSFRFQYLHSGSVDENRPIGWKQTSDAGVLLDLGSHALDMMAWLCGAPAQVFCQTQNLYPTRPLRGGGSTDRLGDDQALMLIRLPEGGMGSVEASKIATGTNDEFSFEIHGVKGALRWSLMDADWLHFFDNTVPEAPLGGLRGYTRIECVGRYPAPGGAFLPPKNTVGWVRAHVACYYNFLDAVYSGVMPSPSLDEGAEVQRVMDACFESAREGRWVAL